MTITKSALIKLLGDRPIAYHPILARALGGVVEAVFVSQLLYWYDKGKLEDNWIWKTQAEWSDETGLTRSNQETARRNLIKMGVLKEKRKGVPGKMHFQLDLDRLADMLTMLDSDIVETPQSEMPKPRIVECPDSAINNVETPQSITENTSETTIDNKPERVSLREQAKRGEMTNETEIDLLCGYGRDGKAGVADPAKDGAAWLHYRDQAVQAVQTITGKFPNATQQAAISELAACLDFDLELWQKSIHSCQLSNVKPGNVACYLDTYRAGGDYAGMQRGKRNGGKPHDRDTLSDQQRRALA